MVYVHTQIVTNVLQLSVQLRVSHICSRNILSFPASIHSTCLERRNNVNIVIFKDFAVVWFYLLDYFDVSDQFTMLKQVCFPINTIRNWGPNLFDLEKETENTIIILETIGI